MWIVSIAYPENHTKEFEYTSDYCWKWLKVHLEFLLRNFKINLIIIIIIIINYAMHSISQTMYRAIQSQSNLFFSIQYLIQSSQNILKWLLQLNPNFHYFIHVSRVFKRGVEGTMVPLTHTHFLILWNWHTFLTWSKAHNQKNRARIAFRTCLQDDAKEFGYKSDYGWKRLKVPFELFYAFST